MKNTNEKETFESYINKIFPKDCEAYIRLKQLHDDEMYETKDYLCGIIGKNNLKLEEKDKEIKRLIGITKLEREQSKEWLNKIKQLQDEMIKNEL